MCAHLVPALWPAHAAELVGDDPGEVDGRVVAGPLGRRGGDGPVGLQRPVGPATRRAGHRRALAVRALGRGVQGPSHPATAKLLSSLTFTFVVKFAIIVTGQHSAVPFVRESLLAFIYYRAELFHGQSSLSCMNQLGAKLGVSYTVQES